MLAAIATAALSLPVETIGSRFGGIPRELPSPALPAFSFEKAKAVLPDAISFALLAAIESLLSAVVADGVAGTRHDSNQELIGQGIANVLAPLFGGIAATGAIARTATSLRNGADSPIAGVVHSVTLMLVLILLAPLAARIPLCALAAILFVVAWNMSDARHCLRMARTAPRADVIILLITFALTVLVDLVVAVNIGVILALLQFLRRMSATVDVVRQDGEPLRAELRARGWPEPPPGLAVYSIEGPLFFGAVDNLERALRQVGRDTRMLVIRLERVPFMDFTGIQALQEALHKLQQDKVRVLLCGANQRVLRKLVRAELVRRDESPPRYFGDLGLALAACAAPPADDSAASRCAV